ncbi:centromere-associated protein E [Spea bombifrons]|uniref:centromere-associated protein E n=1 Tax=Spea bombifrons TaxID=233779 RepID=UPI002349CAD9|nr:centromere-associated protein E [Spea bombifrons]
MSEGDAVKVCVRIRPLIQREQGDQVNLLWKSGKSTISQVDGAKSFNFDRVFHSNETTSQVYQETAVPIIRSVLQGYNGTIFAYGQTSSGKTYTMMGTPSSLGVIPQAVQDVFKIIQEIPTREFLLRVSYMEIYNETVTDLLCDDRKKKPLEVREDINRTVYVADLTEELVTIPDHVIQWIKKGEKNRHYGVTKMNEHSSRSHTIFRMIIESRERNDPGNSENCEGAVMVSHLNLVDLAGSERASQTGAEGVRLKEGCNINRSLFILGQVIKKLSDGQAGGFINYRDSKLTRILQNSLGGNARTLIICTVTPVSFDETLSTLQFASTAKHVRNTPHVNEVLDDQALLKRYRKEIMDLKKQLEDLEASSESRAQAMAKEERSQLLDEIKLLKNESENRIWNLTNIVVASSQESEQELRAKRKRRVTWAPGKTINSFGSSNFPNFEIPSKMTTASNKRAKFSDLTLLTEIDDSVCTEFSDFDDPIRALDELGPETDWNLTSKVTWREKPAHCHSMIDFGSDGQSPGSDQCKGSLLQKSKEMEQKIADLESQLKKINDEHESDAKERELLRDENSKLQQLLQSHEDEKIKLVAGFELKITSLEDQLKSRSENAESIKKQGEGLDDTEAMGYARNDIQKTEPDHAPQNNFEVQVNLEKPPNADHSVCQEQMLMLEQKVLDLEEIIEHLKSQSKQQDEKNAHAEDFLESVQLCEALMNEKGDALEELAIMRNNLDALVLNNEGLKREIKELEQQLKEKNETNEFESLEKEIQKEHEANLIHEINCLKEVVERKKNVEVVNQELETELASKSKLLEDKELQLLELRKHADNLQNKVRNLDFIASVGDGEKLCEEVFQLKQSLSDAEAVTRDAQKESAFLRSENLELKEKMEQVSSRSEQREKDASMYEKQLEAEKTKYKQMQGDLQKELQCAYSEINQLNGLMAGRVPKDLLSRVELEKEVANYSKQLNKLQEEKSILEKEVECLSVYKSLPSEIEHLKQELCQTSEELQLLKNEQEQSASTVRDQEIKLQEQMEQINKLTDEVTLEQSKFHQAEEQYFELKKLHQELEEKFLLAAEEIGRKQSEAECLLKEVEQLKCTVTAVEGKLSSANEELGRTVGEKEHLLQELSDAKQAVLRDEQLKSTQPTKEEKGSEVIFPLLSLDEVTGLIKEKDEIQRAIETERDSYKEQLSSLADLLQEQANKQSEFNREKQEFEEHQSKLFSEIEQLQNSLKDAQASLDAVQAEKFEISEQLQSIQKELEIGVQQRHDLQVTLGELKAERDDLKQDLNENIELSIETQDELRSTQEELKQQKQLVNELRKQIEATANSIPLQGLESNMEEEISALTTKLNENELKFQELYDEKLVLEKAHQDLVCEMELLQERMTTAEQALAEAQQEAAMAGQKIFTLEEQLISISSERNETEHQCEDVKIQELQEQLLATTHDGEELQEILKTVRAERDQLKLDLQESIEMSIETQEELRGALEELKNKKQMLDDLKHQANEQNMVSDDHCKNPQRDLELRAFDLQEKMNVLTCERDSLLVELQNITDQKTELEELVSRLTAEQDVQEKSAESLLVPALAEKLQETEAKYQELHDEKCSLETAHQSLINKMELLQQRMTTTELALVQAQQEAEQKMSSPEGRPTSVFYEEHTIKGLQEEKDTQTEEERRTAQEELIALLEVEKAERNHLKCQVEEEHKKVEEQKLKLDSIFETLKETESKYEKISEKLEQVTEERDQLLFTLDSLTTNGTLGKGPVSCRQAKDQELQTEGKYAQETEESMWDIKKSLEETQAERNLLNEKLDQLKDQLCLFSQEKEELQKVIDDLNTELNQKMKDLEEYEHELNEKDASASEYGDEKPVLARRSSRDGEHNESAASEIRLLEESLQCSQELLESAEQEKVELLSKLSLLHHELENVKLHKEEIQSKLESLLSENVNLRESMKHITKCGSEVENVESVSCEELDRKQVFDDLRGETVHNSSTTHQNETATNSEVSSDDKVDCLMEEKTTAQLQLVCEKGALEETQTLLQGEMETLSKTLHDTQSALESLEREKHEAQRELQSLQQQMEAATQEKDDLKITLFGLESERDQLKEQLHENIETIIQMKDELQKKIAEEQHIFREKQELKESQERQKEEMEQVMESLKNAELTLQTLKQEKVETEQKLLDLQQQTDALYQEREDLKIAQENLLLERDQLKESLKEQNEMVRNGDIQHAHKFKDEVERLTGSMKDTEATLLSLQQEKAEALQKLADLEMKMETLAQEGDELKMTQENLKSERDQLKEELKENVELVMQFKHELEKKAAEEQQMVHEKQQLEQSQQRLKDEIEQLTESLKDTGASLQTLQQEKAETEEKLHDLQQLTETLSNERNELKITQEKLTSERDQLKEDLKENIDMSVETQDDLRRAQEELQQQKKREEQLTNQISSLQENISSLEKELRDHETIMSEGLGDREVLNESLERLTSNVEQLNQTLRGKELELEHVKREKEEASKKARDLTEDIQTVTEERDQLLLSKETLQEEAEKLRIDLETLKNQHDVLQVLQTKESSRLEELVTEIDQLKEKMESRDATVQNMEDEKNQLQKTVLEQELKISSLYQDQEQFQQLLQRVRSEKENIYNDLQAQETESAQLLEELSKCKLELQTIKQKNDEINETLGAKANKIEQLLLQVSALELKTQELEEEVKNEKLKNVQLCDELDQKKEEILLLNLKPSEPLQEEDEVAECTNTLENQNEKLMDLMVKISSGYSDHHSLLTNLSSELQTETELYKQMMCQVKEVLSSAQSRSFGNLQTEHQKLNVQLITLLNKFQIIYRNAAVKEEQYSLIKVYEHELIAEQKRNDELKLQIQSLEQNGTKWSESAAEKFKFCQLEFLKKQIDRKCNLTKLVEDDLSEVQTILTSVGEKLQEEVKSKKDFHHWLDEFKGLHFDPQKLNDGVQQENKRLSGLLQLMTKKLKAVVQSKINREVKLYIKQFEKEIQETKDKNTELLKRVQQLAPSANMNAIDEENARLQEQLKGVHAQLKKMQSRIQALEGELDSAKVYARQKGETASLLQSKLLSHPAEAELSKMQAKMAEQENNLQAALKEIKNLHDKVSKGAKPYQEEIDDLKTQVVKIEMEKMKLTKSMDKEIASLKACVDDKEECLRKLKEKLRRMQNEGDATVCIEKIAPSSSQFPVTCGGGSGIVQSTALLVLRSEKAALEKELAQYKKKYLQMSRNTSDHEDKQKGKVSEAAVSRSSISHQSLGMSSSSSVAEAQRPPPVSPTKSEILHFYVTSPGRTGLSRKRGGSPCKAQIMKPVALSPCKAERLSMPTVSPKKSAVRRKSPVKLDGPLLSNLTVSPSKKQNLQQTLDSPKSKFFDVRSKSLPYCPTQFFDNSKLGDFPDLNNEAAAPTSQNDEWWFAPKKPTTNECKTS